VNILIVKVSALGDVVHALPVLAWLKSAQSDVQIDWLVEESFAPFLDAHPMVRHLHRINTKAWRRDGVLTSLKGFKQTVARLRREQYDLVLDLQGNAKSGFFTLFCGASKRYGFDKDSVRETPNLLATNRKVALDDQAFHITDRSLAIAKAALPHGTEARLAGPLPLDEAAQQSVRSILQEKDLSSGPLVVLHYGTTWETKLWSLKSWQTLASRLVEQGVRPILTWGNQAEADAVKAIDQSTGQRCCIWPRGSLKELTALLAEVDLVVGGDTGPIHIAAAVNTPTVSIFRATDAARNAPRGEMHRSIQSRLDCSPCLKKQCDRDAECCASITVEELLPLVDQALQTVE